MDGKIKNVITGDIEAVDPVINRKGKISYVSPHKGPIILRRRLRRVEKITEVPDNRVIPYKNAFIPLKGDVEGIGIDNKTEQADYCNMKKALIENSGDSANINGAGGPVITMGKTHCYV